MNVKQMQEFLDDVECDMERLQEEYTYDSCGRGPGCHDETGTMSEQDAARFQILSDWEDELICALGRHNYYSCPTGCRRSEGRP